MAVGRSREREEGGRDREKGETERQGEGDTERVTHRKKTERERERSRKRERGRRRERDARDASSNMWLWSLSLLTLEHPEPADPRPTSASTHPAAQTHSLTHPLTHGDTQFTADAPSQSLTRTPPGWLSGLLIILTPADQPLPCPRSNTCLGKHPLCPQPQRLPPGSQSCWRGRPELGSSARAQRPLPRQPAGWMPTLRWLFGWPAGSRAICFVRV